MPRKRRFSKHRLRVGFDDLSDDELAEVAFFGAAMRDHDTVIYGAQPGDEARAYKLLRERGAWGRDNADRETK